MSISSDHQSTPQSIGSFVLLFSLGLGAFLLFLVQPLLGRIILPRFGSSPAIWTACMLFFQALLVGGYMVAYGLSHLRSSLQLCSFVGLVSVALLSLFLIPMYPFPSFGVGDPTIEILVSLAFTIGLPYLCLSSISPLLQHWHARIYQSSSRSSYSLYALSNFASFSGLLAYPFIFELFFPLSFHTIVWQALFTVFCISAVILSWLLWSQGTDLKSNSEIEQSKASSQDRVLWLVLPFISSSTLLAVTNHVSSDVSPMPIIWILCLMGFLLSFILSFSERVWYRFTPFFVLLTMALIAFCFRYELGVHRSLLMQVSLGVTIIFTIGMICHATIYSLRPAYDQLTTFYLYISIGGALGGIFVGIFAPLLFNSYIELPLSIVLVMGVLCYLHYVGAISINETFNFSSPTLVFCFIAILNSMLVSHYEISKIFSATLSARDFFGVYRVIDYDHRWIKRTLQHGTTLHSVVAKETAEIKGGLSYYGPTSGVGVTFKSFRNEVPREIGIIGLGGGTNVLNMQEQDSVTFIEISPMVIKIARDYFPFLAQGGERVRIIEGDGRKVLSDLDDQNYDILVIDAFSSDAIPVHLLTEEAFKVYFKHVDEQSVLVAHISNRNLDLASSIASTAYALGRKSILVVDTHVNSRYFTSKYLIITNNQAFRRRVLSEHSKGSVDITEQHMGQPWRDEYNGLMWLWLETILS